MFCATSARSPWSIAPKSSPLGGLSSFNNCYRIGTELIQAENFLNLRFDAEQAEMAQNHFYFFTVKSILGIDRWACN